MTQTLNGFGTKLVPHDLPQEVGISLSNTFAGSFDDHSRLNLSTTISLHALSLFVQPEETPWCGYINSQKVTRRQA